MSTNVGSIIVDATVDDGKFNSSLKNLEKTAKSSANVSETHLKGIEATADISAFNKAMDDMVAKAKDTASKVTSSLTTASKGVGIGLAGIGVGAFAAASGISEMVSEVAKLNSTGLGTEQLMGAIKAMQQYGFTAEETADHLKTISEAAYGNAQAWNEAGVAVTDASGEYLSLDQVIKNLITVMQDLSPEQQKALAEMLGLGEAAGFLSLFMSDLTENLETYNSVTGESVTSMEELKEAVEEFNKKIGEMKIELLKSVGAFLGFLKTNKETIKTVVKLTVAFAGLWIAISFFKAVGGAIIFLAKMTKSIVVLGIAVVKNAGKFIKWGVTVIATSGMTALKFGKDVLKVVGSLALLALSSAKSAAKQVASMVLTMFTSGRQAEELDDDGKKIKKTNDEKSKSFLQSAKEQIASLAAVKKTSDKQEEELDQNEDGIDKINEQLARSFKEMADDSIEDLTRLNTAMRLSETASRSMKEAMESDLKNMEKDFDKYINKMIAKVGALGAALVAVGLLPGGTAALKGADKIAERGGDVAGSGVFDGVDLGPGKSSFSISSPSFKQNPINNINTNTTSNTFNIMPQKTMSFTEAYRQANISTMRGVLV